MSQDSTRSSGSINGGAENKDEVPDRQRLSVLVRADSYGDFVARVEKKHGKRKGTLGVEMTRAIQFWNALNEMDLEPDQAIERLENGRRYEQLLERVDEMDQTLDDVLEAFANNDDVSREQ